MKANTRLLKSLTLAAVGTLAATQSVQAADLLKRSLCVFDPVGANGPIFNLMKSSVPEAQKWGVDMELRAYTDEKIAAEDFKAKQCDSVLLTGTRAREFNNFTGTLEAIGAIPSDKEMREVMATLNTPRAKEFLVNGNYEVAGIMPAGAVYLFLRDRNIDSVEKMQGKKVATLDYDNASVTMVRHVGASVVGSNAANFAGKFNNGSVDIAYAPAVAYTPMELYKGLANNGAVLKYALAQMNFQVLINKDRFPEGYGDKVREYTFSRQEEAYDVVRQAEAEIKPELWLTPKPEDVQGYDNMLREVRIGLRDSGTYDARALRLMRAVRCKNDATRAECAEERE